MTDMAREHVVRAAEALIKARQHGNLARSREQNLEQALESAVKRYWAAKPSQSE